MRSLKILAVAALAMISIASAAQQPVPLGPQLETEATNEGPVIPQPVPAGGAPLNKADLDAWLDGYMPYALQSNDIAGAVVAVVKDGKIVSERGFGYSDVAARKPVDPKSTLFRPGSVSKLITWTAVMQMVEQGKIDLDADVNNYLDFKIPALHKKPITMRNLMQHTAGFEEQAKGILARAPDKLPSYETILKRWTPTRIFAAGTTPAYSNYGASLAGYIVQRVSGEPFDDYVERHIFSPLAMRHSTFRQPLPKSLQPYMSKGYSVASEDPGGFEIVGPAPAGGMSASGEDMARFMIAHLEGGAINGRRILQPATVSEMHNSPLTVIPPLNRMELGFFETNINGREVIAHLGDLEDFHTSLHLFLKDRTGFYVSFNSPGKAGAAGSLRNVIFQDFADRYLPGSRPTPGAINAKTTRKHAAMMVGSWWNSRRSATNFLNAATLIGQTKVVLGPKGELMVPSLTGSNGQPFRWTEIAPFVWLASDGHQRLAAKLVDGQPVRFSMDQLSPFMVFDRVPWYKNSAWLMPALYLSLAILFLTAVLWPVRAITRRSYGHSLDLERSALIGYRLSRIGALAMLAALLGWAGTVLFLISDSSRLTTGSDPLLWFTEIVGAFAFLGGFTLILWNLWVTWAGGGQRRWTAKVWSLLLALAGLITIWVGLAFHLIDFGVNY